jgi:hypothetical protein
MAAGVRFPTGQDLSLLHIVQTGSAVHPEGHSPGKMRSERNAYHSPPFSADVKNGGAIPPLSHIS